MRSYLGRSRPAAERPTGKTGSEKSAEVVVAEVGRKDRRPRRRAEREGQSRDMLLGKARHQKPERPQGGSERTVAGRGEAAFEAVGDEAELARHAQTDCGAGDLLGQALARENMVRAWKRVKANKGSAGVDGRTVLETGEYLRAAWPTSEEGCLTAVTGPSRCAAWASPSRVAGRASWGYRPWWTG